jgi:signal peptidase II
MLLLLTLLAATVGCDRITKHLAIESLRGAPDQSFFAGTVRLEYAENSGGLLSIGAQLNPSLRFAIFTVATAVILIGLLIIAIKYPGSAWHVTAFGLALAGGASNLIDRLIRGTVVDFVTIGVGHLRTGVFNVADVAVFAGIMMLLVSPFPGSHGSKNTGRG